MAIAQKVAGYSLGQADLLRRAMGKKKKAELDKQYVGFERGHAGQRLLGRRRDQDAVGHPAPVLRLRVQQGALRRATAWSSYWTAYLKANYPAEYMAALLTSRRATTRTRSAIYLAECRRMGIKVLPPRRQRLRRRLHPGRHRHPLRPRPRSATSAPTSSPRSSRTRKAKGAFADFADFLRKVDAVVCNKRTIESLIKAGAFDSLGHSAARADRACYERGGRRGARHQARTRRSASSTCSARCWTTAGGDRRRRRSPSRSPTASGTRRSCCSFEREMLGLYVSDHPLFRRRARAGRARPTARSPRSPARTSRADGSIVTIAGIVSGLAAQGHQAGQPWAAALRRGPRGRHRDDVLPADLPAVLARSWPRTRSSW